MVGVLWEANFVESRKAEIRRTRVFRGWCTKRRQVNDLKKDVTELQKKINVHEQKEQDQQIN